MQVSLDGLSLTGRGEAPATKTGISPLVPVPFLHVSLPLLCVLNSVQGLKFPKDPR